MTTCILSFLISGGIIRKIIIIRIIRKMVNNNPNIGAKSLPFPRKCYFLIYMKNTTLAKGQDTCSLFWYQSATPQFLEVFLFYLSMSALLSFL